MNPITFIYNEILFRPLFNLLVGITNLLPSHNIGLAIILVTIIVRLILLPSSLHQARQAKKNQDKMKTVQKELQGIKKKYKNNKSKQAEETMSAYRRAGINPASGCLSLLIQLPILIALYKVFLVGLNEETFINLYTFVVPPQTLQVVLLGIPLEKPSLLLGVIAGLGQFALMRFFTSMPSSPASDEQSAQMMNAMQKNMTYVFPAMTVFIALQLPAALALYWVASTIFAIGQQYVLKRVLKTTENLPIV